MFLSSCHSLSLYLYALLSVCYLYFSCQCFYHHVTLYLAISMQL
jgi:hypothetical protein